jgi:soluble lytic murein transglycosylase
MKRWKALARAPIGLFMVCSLLALACSTTYQIPFIATPTPTPTPSPSPTSTPTPAPTATPTPTPQPAALLNIGESYIFLGDYEQARQEYQAALGTATDAETKAAAAFGMAKALFYMLNYSTAANELKAITVNYPDTAASAEAWYFLGESYAAQKLYPQAAQAYQRYLDLRPNLLEGYIQEQRGDALLTAGDGSGAAGAYQNALVNPPPGDPVWLRLKLSKALSLKKDYKGAVTLLLDIYQNSGDDYAKAQADWLLGQTYLILGVPEQAQARFMDAAINFPKSYDSYSSLVQLVNAGVEISDLNRGIVDYYAGQYSLCTDALNRYIHAAKPQEATAFYYRGLCSREANQVDDAIADFEVVVKDYSGDRLWSRAVEQKAYTLWAYQDKYEPAAEALITYAGMAGDAQNASAALFEAGRIYERGGQLDKAAKTWEQLINTYPTAEDSYHGLFLSGISYYRLKNYPTALTTFQRALVLASNPSDQAGAYLWIGKTQQIQGDSETAHTSWEQGVQRDPTGYYSQRSAELLVDRKPFITVKPFDLGYNLNAERAEAETWLRAALKIETSVDLSSLGEMAQDPALLRGVELYRLGRYAEARDEFEALRKAAMNDPAQTYRLMGFFLEHNMYRLAILSSRQILDLAGLDDAGTLRAPRFFNHVRFGIYFGDLVASSSQKAGLNPLFLLSVMRQESLFEPFAQSGAGARGLMQIMPATGKEIASQQHWPENFTTSDLDLPIVSIPFGAAYLARQRDYFDGSLMHALAAYNGGPGNTIAWKELAGDDPDLFLEVIRANETRTYIRQIFEFYNLYRLIYEQTP